MLALYGRAAFCRGIPESENPVVIRLRSSHSASIEDVSDFAIARSYDELRGLDPSKCSGVLVITDEMFEEGCPARTPACIVRLPGQFAYLDDGDVIAIHPGTGRMRALYRRNSIHNSFLVTERCNHYCLMCSQPPKNVDDRWILREIKAAVPLIAKDTKSLGFTGGEPLLDWAEFISVLADCRDYLPKTSIHVLSNGRAFARDEVVAAWAALKHPSLTLGIPIYSAVDHVHDYIVQAAGAFDETVLGVLKLKDKHQRVEIRVVLHALTTPRLVETATWLARNLPFVDHVALMGLENTGFAIANRDMLWIDPVDYREDLARAVHILASSKVAVSVYNLPRCVLDQSVWPYAVQSISDWKNGYLEECELCIEKSRCSGFFTSGRPRRSRGIQPITTAVTIASR